MMSLERNRIANSVLILLATLFSVNVSAAPKSYPLMCKGGGNYDFRVAQDRSGTGTEISFRYKTTGAAASAGLSAGECAWMDRGVNNVGQRILVMTFPRALALVTLRKNGSSVRPIIQYGGSSATLKKIVNKIMGGGDFQVYAYYDSEQEALIATKIGP